MSVHIYMNQAPGAEQYNYRGLADSLNSARSLRAKMKREGYDVVLAAGGESPPVRDADGELSVEHWIGLPREHVLRKQNES